MIIEKRHVDEESCNKIGTSHAAFRRHAQCSGTPGDCFRNQLGDFYDDGSHTMVCCFDECFAYPTPSEHGVWVFQPRMTALDI